jgi:hypothetical protein
MTLQSIKAQIQKKILTPNMVASKAIIKMGNTPTANT